MLKAPSRHGAHEYPGHLRKIRYVQGVTIGPFACPSDPNVGLVERRFGHASFTWKWVNRYSYKRSVEFPSHTVRITKGESYPIGPMRFNFYMARAPMGQIRKSRFRRAPRYCSLSDEFVLPLSNTITQHQHSWEVLSVGSYITNMSANSATRRCSSRTRKK